MSVFSLSVPLAMGALHLIVCAVVGKFLQRRLNVRLPRLQLLRRLSRL